MLDKISYPLNIALATIKLTDPPSSDFTGNRPNPRTTKKGFDAFEIVSWRKTQQDKDCKNCQLLFCLDNLYLEGFQNTIGVFLHEHSSSSINHTRKLKFGNDYGALGYRRTTAITVTLDNLNGALATFKYADTKTPEETIKKAFLYCAIGFSEAIRFNDVIQAILKGEPITDLDWDKHEDATMVRVVKV